MYVSIIKCIVSLSHLFYHQSTGSEDTSTVEDEPVILGFGIPAPPPSYRAAVKNTDVYKVITSSF